MTLDDNLVQRLFDMPPSAARATGLCALFALPRRRRAARRAGPHPRRLQRRERRLPAGCAPRPARWPRWCWPAARRLQAVLVVGAGAEPCTPCGGCRQKLREFGDDALPVLVADPSGLRARFTLGQLLPASFGPDHLTGAPR
jgi:hypothetical protein